jgi:anaerobic selenocysteine-containing dehydrogenase
MGADRRKTWWLFDRLARRLGIDLIEGLDTDIAEDDDVLRYFAAAGRQPPEELMAAGPRGYVLPRMYGWVHDRVLPGGKWQIAHEALVDRLPALLEADEEPQGLTLVSGRDQHNLNRMAYGRFGFKRFGGEEEAAVIGINPEDAARQGLEDGALVTVKGAEGSVTAKLRIDDSLLPGTLHMPHGWVGRNVCQLTSPEIDPQTGQPVMMSAIPVQIALAS